MLKQITVHGARQHNLKNIDVAIPRNTLTVITGLSGSGKSSLAFDTIYAEGQRRYVETLSPYARQFLDQMERPEVDSIDGLSPAISIEQKTTSRSPRSTVGTITEIYDYLRVLYAAIGVPHCPTCGLEISRQSSQQILQQVMLLGPLPLPTSVDVSGTPSHVPRKGRRSGSRRLHAGHRLASTRVPASLIPAGHERPVSMSPDLNNDTSTATPTTTASGLRPVSLIPT